MFVVGIYRSCAPFPSKYPVRVASGGRVGRNTRPLRHLRILLQHSRSLPDRQSYFGSMLDGLREKGFVQVIACIEQPIDFRAVARPLLKLVEIAVVCVVRVVGLLLAMNGTNWRCRMGFLPHPANSVTHLAPLGLAGGSTSPD
jgi:hypothetical protein